MALEDEFGIVMVPKEQIAAFLAALAFAAFLEAFGVPPEAMRRA